jgi:AcrR family transcriptional regulator
MTSEPIGRRAQNRLARHEQLTRAATEIIAQEGLAGLTMQAVAERVDCAVGTIYTYFDSKSALLAELQVEAIRTLISAVERSREIWDEEIAAAELDDAVAALVRLVAAGHLFVAVTDMHPREFELLQLHISLRHQEINDRDTPTVVPHALALLGQLLALIDAAVEVGALSTRSEMGEEDGGQTLRRTLRWAGGLNGAMMVSNATADPAWLTSEQLDGRRLAHALSEDMLLGWGAPPRTLLTAKEFVASLDERDRLMRPGGDLEDAAPVEAIDGVEAVDPPLAAD